jgi:hypothetical protein
LPTPPESIKQVEQREQRRIKQTAERACPRLWAIWRRACRRESD